MNVSLLQLAKLLSFSVFILYGPACLLSSRMVLEFERYGMADRRVLVGSLETLGALGLLVGYVVPWVGTLAAAGLAVLMVVAVWTRMGLGDSLLQTLPALVLLLANGYIVWAAVRAR